MTARPALLLLALISPAPRPAPGQGYAPDAAPARMAPADGLAVKLFAAEPDVRQPILVKCDDRGRLWTIQYLQYPNPAGLKRVKVDRFSRTVYDRVPEPPPRGPRGADRITICTDTDGDGRADRFHDFVTGLNLATGLAFGHGGVYVLQAPYLLFYPDRDRDDVPDADPEVVLSGFGLDDAQSLVNHLTFGPDGWLYGVTGSTSTNVVRGVEFQQAVWRVHPVSKRFELFCEGGGNLFGLTFDADGNLFFSSNGNDLAYHAAQGGYYRKNFGKHGPLHNPYAYGFFEHLPYDAPVAGPRPGGTVYLGDSLPERFRGAFLCNDFLQHGASWWRLERRGSTFAAKYGGRLLDARDTWFCSPDLNQGADGAVYVCDFHDRRTAHPDPDANWDRSNGRIYRIAPPGTRGAVGLDLARKSSRELVDLLRHPNGWYADQARALLAARRDRAVWPDLLALARQSGNPRLALQGLWGLHVSGGFDEAAALELLRHPHDSVRAWVVRLLGDGDSVSPALAAVLVRLAATEPSVRVRSQLASTARRLPGRDGLAVVEPLLARGLDRDDPYLPLLLWWAVEAKALTDTDRVLELVSPRRAWDDPCLTDLALKLVRRYAADGTPDGDAACERLLAGVPSKSETAALAALDLGLAERGAAVGGIGMAGSAFESVAVPGQAKAATRRAVPPSAGLRSRIEAAWKAAPGEVLRTRLALRGDVPGALAPVTAAVNDPSTPDARRREWLGVLAGQGGPAGASAALAVLSGAYPVETRGAALDVLARHGDDATAAALLRAYAKAPPALRGRIRDVSLGRPGWARAFLGAVDRGEVPTSDVPLDALRTVALHGDPALDALVRKHWGMVKAGTPEGKLAEMRRLSNDLRAGEGDRARGKALFAKHCATCHALHGEGGAVGPDLTGVARDDTTALLASLVDPSAVVRGPYLQYAAVTAGGRVVAGVIVAQDGAGVTLADAQGKRTTLPRSDVEELRELPGSLMPEDLLKPLAPQDVRDLFRYLQSPR